MKFECGDLVEVDGMPGVVREIDTCGSVCVMTLDGRERMWHAAVTVERVDFALFYTLVREAVRDGYL